MGLSRAQVDTSRKLAIVLKWVGGSDYLRTSFFYFSFSFGEQILSQFCFCFVWNAGFDDFSPPRDSLRSGNHFFLCFFFFSSSSSSLNEYFPSLPI
jgi:hypothetical protein